MLPTRLRFFSQRVRCSTLMAPFSSTPSNGGWQVVVDLGYPSSERITPTHRDRQSLVTQLCFAYNHVKNATQQPLFHLTSFCGEIAEMLRKQGVENWQAKLHQEAVFDVFDKDQLVYLTPDSDHVLECVDEGKVYVIGGFVDKQVRKRRSLHRAFIGRVQTARLPVKEMFPLRTGNTLNINHVVHALTLFAENGCWEHALKTAVPKRIQQGSGRLAKKLKQRNEILSKRVIDPFHCNDSSENDLDDQSLFNSQGNSLLSQRVDPFYCNNDSENDLDYQRNTNSEGKSLKDDQG